MKQQIRIEAAFAAFGTKVLDQDGKPLAQRIRRVQFEHEVGDIPRLTLECFPEETVTEGEMEVRRIVVCPCCRKELEQQINSGATEIGTADTSTVDQSSDWATFVPAPIAPADASPVALGDLIARIKADISEFVAAMKGVVDQVDRA